MRTLVLTEHQPKAERLEDHELAELVAARHVEVRALGGDEYELQPGSTVGTSVGAHLRLLIRPKISMPNLFFLLGWGEGLTRWTPQHFPYAGDDLLAAVGWLLEAEVREASRFGLVRDYRVREERLTMLRGRIDAGAQLRRLPGQPLPLHCRFDEFDQDTDLNRVVKAALRRLALTPGMDESLRFRLRHHHHHLFDAVTEAEWPTTAVPTLAFTRRDEHWKAAGRIAELVLRAAGVRDQEGGVRASSFTVDMNQLFERFVQRVVEREARRRGLVVDAQARRTFGSGVQMRPDLIVRGQGVDVAVADVKYKRIEYAEWKNADLYQALAYCTALGLRDGTLIYGEAASAKTCAVRGSDIRLHVEGVDLSQPPTRVLESATVVARRLLDRVSRGAAPDRAVAA